MTTTNNTDNKKGIADAKTFEQKLIDLQSNMMSFALTLTANKDDAEDLIQETTLRALNNRDKYYENVNFKGWVFTIIHNLFVNNYRRMVRSQTIIDQTENLYHLNMPQESGFTSPEGAYTVSEIQKAMDSSADEYRIPFEMHIQGYKYEEIADELKLPIGTVKSRIFFARKRLQEMLLDYKNIDRE